MRFCWKAWEYLLEKQLKYISIVRRPNTTTTSSSAAAVSSQDTEITVIDSSSSSKKAELGNNSNSVALNLLHPDNNKSIISLPEVTAAKNVVDTSKKAATSIDSGINDSKMVYVWNYTCAKSSLMCHKPDVM